MTHYFNVIRTTSHGKRKLLISQSGVYFPRSIIQWIYNEIDGIQVDMSLPWKELSITVNTYSY